MSEPRASEPAAFHARRLADAMTSLLDEVFRALSPLGDVASRALTRHSADAFDEVHDELEAPAKAILLEQRAVAVSGTGFAADPGQGGRPWMAWWVQREGVVKPKQHNLNPSSDAFYDYQKADWFDRPRLTGERCVAGPFIDSWGTDDFTITAAVPVPVGEAFGGVVAADLAVRQFERATTAQLRAIEAPAALVNREDRVVASGVPALTTGLRLSPRAGADSDQRALTRFSAAYGWSVVLLPR